MADKMAAALGFILKVDDIIVVVDLFKVFSPKQMLNIVHKLFLLLASFSISENSRWLPRWLAKCGLFPKIENICTMYTACNIDSDSKN